LLKTNKNSPGIVLYFQNSGDHNATLKLSPTYRQCELTLNLDDYGKKESTTIEISQGAEGSDRGKDYNP